MKRIIKLNLMTVHSISLFVAVLLTSSFAYSLETPTLPTRVELFNSSGSYVRDASEVLTWTECNCVSLNNGYIIATMEGSFVDGSGDDIDVMELNGVQIGCEGGEAEYFNVYISSDKINWINVASNLIDDDLDNPWSEPIDIAGNSGTYQYIKVEDGANVPNDEDGLGADICGVRALHGAGAITTTTTVDGSITTTTVYGSTTTTAGAITTTTTAGPTSTTTTTGICPPESPIDCGDGTGCCFTDYPYCCGDGYCYQNPGDCDTPGPSTTTTATGSTTTTAGGGGCSFGYPIDCGDGWCCISELACILPPELRVGICIEPTTCLSVALYGEHSEETELLRYFRDSVLTQTSEGQEIIRLYYEWSPAIVKAMEEDEEFKEEIKEMIDGILLLIR